MKVKSPTNNDNDIAAGVIRVNIFFAHRIKEIDIKRYGDDIFILLSTNTVKIYNYSNEILKNMPKDALATIENHILYGKQKVQIYRNNNGRRAH